MATRKTPAVKKAAAKKTTPAPPAAKRATARKAAPTKRAPAKKSNARARARKPTDRDRQVLELRRAGIPFDKIAARLKYPTREQVHDAYERALAETLPQPAEDVRRLELDRLERLITPLWPKAMNGDVAAISQLASLSAQRTRVVGEGSPLMPEVVTAHEPGPTERAALVEIERLRQPHHPLAAAALVMARFVDDAGGNAVAAATASREMRQALNNLHSYAGDAVPRPEQRSTGGVVVPQSRLAEIRAKAAARGSSRG